ncbi:hypothetical protein M422DRAFT_272951 [Sphaerobolus stellatus SS14]|uniref:Uncharacterized protein n=1 Tax=Sphaerobolus stellatus (strain SS14) TaxID=990650 RepID=A0A0C9TAC8_SPHS4|nr:hypothetical protein M422DRAFT_272951 [Sphaerobolus stellatus SS14]
MIALAAEQIQNTVPAQYPPLNAWVNSMLDVLPNQPSPVDDVDSGLLAELNRSAAHYLTANFVTGSKTHSAIESFTGGAITNETISMLINDPKNAFLLESDARTCFAAGYYAWGIEALKQENGKYRYFLRVVRAKHLSFTLRDANDGQDIKFGTGVFGNGINLPDPGFCNLKLSIARILHLSRAASIFEKYFKYEEYTGSSVLGVF